MVHGLRGWKLTLDHSRRRAGQCKYQTRTISISRYLTELHSEDEVRDTILHEIAHALTPGDGHGEVWRRTCLAIGGNGQRTHSAATVPGRWLGTCPSGHTVRRHRMTKRLQQGVTCATCDPHNYNPRFLMRWVDTGVKVR